MSLTFKTRYVWQIDLGNRKEKSPHTYPSKTAALTAAKKMWKDVSEGIPFPKEKIEIVEAD